MAENTKNDFLVSLERLLTTQLGIVRLKRNLEAEDANSDIIITAQII